MASDITVGKLKLEADSTQIIKMKDNLAELKKGMPTVGSACDKLVESVREIPGPAGVAAVAIAALGAAAIEITHKVMESIEALEHLSSTTQISAEKLQVMQLAMTMGGADASTFSAVMNRLNKSVSEAHDPTSKQAALFHAMGISQKEIMSSSPEEMMKKVAASFSEMAPSANKAALEMELLGRSGTEVDAAMSELGANTKLAEDILKQHGAITKEDIEQQKEFNKALTILKATFTGLATDIVTKVTPALTKFVEWCDIATNAVDAWYERSISRFSAMIEQTAKFSNALDKNFLATWEGDAAAQKAAMKEMGNAFTADIYKSADTAFAKRLADYQKMMDTAFAKKPEGGPKIDAPDPNAVGKSQEAANKFAEAMKKQNEAVKEANLLFAAATQGSDAFAEAQILVKARADAVSAGLTEGSVAWNALTETAQRALKTLQGATELNAANLAIEKLTDSTKALYQQQVAGSESAEAFKEHQHDVEIAAAIQSATFKKNAEAVAEYTAKLKENYEAADLVKDEGKGWELINQLVAQRISLVTRETELQKTLASIDAAPGMTEHQKELAKALASANQQTIDQNAITKGLNESRAQATAEIAKETAALTLTSSQMNLYNQLAQQQKAFNEQILGKTPDQIAQITANWKTNTQALKDNYDTMQKMQTTQSAFFAGATKGMNQYIEQATNMNTLGVSFTNTLANGLTTAFMNMGTQGKKAWQTLEVSMLNFFAQFMLKMLMAQAMQGFQALFGGGSGGASGVTSLLGAGAGTASLTANTTAITAETTATTALVTALGTQVTTDTANILTETTAMGVLTAALVANTAAVGAGAASSAGSSMAAGGGAMAMMAAANGAAYSGGRITAFADGGVLSGPTMTPMALMGEAGPEAVMPLSRNNQGQLGISMNGQTSGGATYVNHINNIAIHSNQDPKDIAKQVRKQTQMAGNQTRQTIQQEQRSGGQLYNRSSAFGH